jgi:hypothetical protein
VVVVVAVLAHTTLATTTLLPVQPTLVAAVAVGTTTPFMVGLLAVQRLAGPVLWSSNGGSSNGAFCRT